MTDNSSDACQQDSISYRDFHWEFGCARPQTLGEGLALGIFLFTCFQAAFIFPDVTIVPGERAKLFPALLAALSLLAAVVLGKRSHIVWSKREIAISGVLTILIILSSLFSDTWQSSSLRGFVVVASGLGGFWCARILLQGPGRQWFFVGYCSALFFYVGLIGLMGYVEAGSIIEYLDVNPHPLACRIMLLSFAPIALIMLKRPLPLAVGSALIVLTYSMFFFSTLRSAMLIPIILGGLAVAYGSLRLKYLLIVLIPLALVIGVFFSSLPQPKRGLVLEEEPMYYRVENYPFSLHIAMKHPWLGIGLRAPRDAYLDDYEIKYPYVSRERFADSLNRVVTSENTFLNFMVDLGFPFFFLYGTVIVWFVVQLNKNATSPIQSPLIPPLALLLSVTAGLMHFLVLDGLMHPHVSWFFHILLGLVPIRRD
jgi:hypothetical protein